MLILITGASSGIGAALCHYYASPDVTLCMLARNESALKTVSKGCGAQGARTYTYFADVSDTDKMTEIGNEIVLKVGLPDLIIANAGIRIEDPEDYKNSTAPYEVMMTNYIGVINTFSPFIDLMLKRKRGHLVAISSIAALRATPNSGIYSASKAAINLWTEALRLRLLPHDIYVTTAMSGFVRTAMTAGLSFYMPGILSAEQAATIIAKAIERRKSRIIFPWQSRIIWGVFRAMPGFLYDWTILCAKRFWPNRT